MTARATSAGSRWPRCWAHLAELQLGHGAAELELIQREIYAIAQVKRPDVGRMHDVLVVGSVHGEFRIVDPLDPTDLMNTMGIYHNRAYGLRYLVPNDTGE